MRWLVALAVCVVGCGDNSPSTQDAGADGAGSDSGACSSQFPLDLPASTMACSEVTYPGLPSLDSAGIVRSVVATDLDEMATSI